MKPSTAKQAAPKAQAVTGPGNVVARQRQTGSASAAPQVARAGVKPCKPCEAKHGPKFARCPHASQKQAARRTGNFAFIGRLREGAAAVQAAEGKRFRVTILQEGMGNFGDAFYYTPAAIQSGVPLFEGKKFMVDHPGVTEEENRPERSVRDIAGYFEKVTAEEVDGRMELTADCVVAGDPSDPKDPFARERALMREAITFQQAHPEDALVGLSINAGGEYDTVPLVQFIESGDIPEACKPKLIQAMQEGVTEVCPVTELRSAVSCDLVTTAGAGGSINQLLEGGKTKMAKQTKQAKQSKQAEAEAKQTETESKQTEAGLDASGADDHDGGDDSADDSAADDAADGQDAEHPDAEQDEELIRQMLDKYVGKPAHPDEDVEAMKQALTAAKEAGYEGKKAEEAAAAHLKMSRAAAAKGGMATEAESEAEAHESEAQESEAQESDDTGFNKGSATVGGAGSAKGMQKNKESAKPAQGGTSMVKLLARLAAAEAEIAGLRLEKHVDKALRESKLPNSATKKFRESIGSKCKTAAEFDGKLAVFKEAYSLRGEAEQDGGFILGAEKQDGASEVESGMDFSDCNVSDGE